jgi:hypothetical protein
VSLHSGVRGWGHRSRTSGGSGTATFPAPVLTWVSDTATRDPVFSSTQIQESDNVQLQVDDNSDFSSLYGDDTHTITALEASDGQLSSSIPTLAYGTTYYARVRYQRLGVWSGWSASVSKTMDAAVAAKLVIGSGATGAGVNRSQFIDSTDGLTATMNNNVGDNCGIRSINGPPPKFHFEVTLGTPVSGFWIGVVDAAVALNAFAHPGNGSAGFSLRLRSADGTGQQGYYNNAAAGVTVPSAPANGQIYSFDVDTTTNTVVVKSKIAGTTTTIGTYVLTSQIPTNWTAYVGGQQNPEPLTVNFGATAFAITPLTGHVGW